MNVNWEVVGSILILAAMLYVAFRGGKENPVTTRQLSIDIHKIKNRMQVIDAELQSAATKGDIEKLRADIAANTSAGASSSEVSELKAKVAVVCEKVEGVEKLAGRTDDGVRRIEKMFLELGIKGRR
jgi:hypothetical protein